MAAPILWVPVFFRAFSAGEPPCPFRRGGRLVFGKGGGGVEVPNLLLWRGDSLKIGPPKRYQDPRKTQEIHEKTGKSRKTQGSPKNNKERQIRTDESKSGKPPHLKPRLAALQILSEPIIELLKPSRSQSLADFVANVQV